MDVCKSSVQLLKSHHGISAQNTMTRYSLFSIVGIVVILMSCQNEEEAAFGKTQLDFVEMLTDANGTARWLARDLNDTLRLTNPISGFKSDTLYRSIAVYSVTANHATISSVTPAISSTPSAFAHQEIYTDPLKVQSIWRGGHYVNLTLNLLSQGLGHTFAFVDKGITTQANGTQTLHLQLYHKQGADPLLYARTAYLSCPLYKYAQQLHHGTDSIFFTIHQFQGESTWKLRY